MFSQTGILYSYGKLLRIVWKLTRSSSCYGSSVTSSKTHTADIQRQHVAALSLTRNRQTPEGCPNLLKIVLEIRLSVCLSVCLSVAGTVRKPIPVLSLAVQG